MRGAPRTSGGRRVAAHAAADQSARIRSIRRIGSAAPQSSWSPTVNAAILAPHRQLAQASDRHVQPAADGRGREFPDADLALVGHDPDPVVAAGDQALYFGHRQVRLQFDRERLAVASHRADAHAQALDRHRAGLGAEDLVGLDRRLPLLAALAVAQILVDPRNQIRRERHAEMRMREIVGRERGADRAVDVENGRRGVAEQGRRRPVDRPHLLDQLAHVLRAGARRRLIGHRRDPLDGAGAHQAADRHQHQRHGAIAADEILDAILPRLAHDRQVHRVEHDDRALVHAQRRRGVDPAALPSRGAQARMHRLRVLTALGAHENRQLRERGDVVRVLHAAGRPADRRRGAAGLRRTEERGLDRIEVAFLAHALQENGADHAAPTDDADSIHRPMMNSCAGGRML